MFEKFVSIADILSFPGMIAVVMMMVQFTKNLFDKLKPGIQTRWVAYGWTFVFCVLAAVLTGDWSSPVATIVVWLVNSVIVWFASMKAYETLAVKPAIAE